MIPVALGGGILAVSLTNAVLQVWLALTVLLNAERRTWGLFLACAALFTGGAFFLLQAAVAALGLGNVWAAMYLQWPLGWYIGLLLPLAWYGVMLWHARFWEVPEGRLWRRHRLWLLVMLGLALAVLILVILAFSYPLSWSRGSFQPFAQPAVAGVPVLAAAYPAFILLCIALALDVLRHPGPSPRLMGDLARQRARPWLIATSLAMLVVSLLVGAIMVGVGLRTPRHLPGSGPWDVPLLVVVGDLVASLLITASILFLGQAIVAYEIFTGKTLPRRGLQRHWYRAIVLAVGYGAVAGWSVAAQSTYLYGLLLATVLLPILYALLNWRSYVARDRSLEHLRPFVVGARVCDSLLDPRAPERDAAVPFRALCAEMLDARVAYLIPVGSLSSLAGRPLAYPESATPPADTAALVARCASPAELCLPVEADTCGGAVWAVPLWSERGLIGLILLGDKTDGGLYTQEEIEIARATGERLIDTLACARMAQRLLALQRQRLAASQVVDRRARRVLHDEVLPRVHAGMLALSAGQEPAEVLEALGDVHRRLSDLLREMPSAADSEVSRHGLIDALRRVPGRELAGAFDEVIWDVPPEAEKVAGSLPLMTAEVLFYAAREAIRNAASHARGDNPNRPVQLKVSVAVEDGLTITIEDDGVGLGVRQSGGGSGLGMALHSTMMAVLGGSWTGESLPGQGTRVTLSLPGSVLETP
jgi:signal transduction histidine kinase